MDDAFIPPARLFTAVFVVRAPSIIMLHRMHDIRTTVIDAPRAALSVSLSVTRIRCSSTAERIEVLRGIYSWRVVTQETLYYILDGSTDFPTDLMRHLPFTTASCQNSQDFLVNK